MCMLFVFLLVCDEEKVSGKRDTKTSLYTPGFSQRLVTVAYVTYHVSEQCGLSAVRRACYSRVRGVGRNACQMAAKTR